MSRGAAGPGVAISAILLLASSALFVLSFLVVKLFFLTLFLGAALFDVFRRGRITLQPRLLYFYGLLSIAGLVWAIVGLQHPGNFTVGIFDSVRLYVVWSAAFVVFYTLLRTVPSLSLLHTALVLAGIGIALINVTALADTYWNWGLVPTDFREALVLHIGIHDGYVQMTTVNIASLFLIVPYLLTLQLRADAGSSNSKLTKLSLFLCLVLTALSGRRALWLTVALTPITLLLLAWVSGQHDRLSLGGRRFLLAYSTFAVLGVGATTVLKTPLAQAGYIQHLGDAFSSEDERSIQKGFLMNAFAEAPVLGSGFGAYAGYRRSDDSPWMYELTYQQMLFNLGIVGVSLVGGIYCLYLLLVIRTFRISSRAPAIPFALLVGLVSVLIGVYSNPYAKSFDVLLFVGLLPYLATFPPEFDEAVDEGHGFSAVRSHDVPGASAI